MKKLESGRSMVEMLGVLAVIGILSIGGIVGFSLSMSRYKANAMLDKATKYASLAYAANLSANALKKNFNPADFKYENQSLLGGSKIDVDLSLNNYGNQQNNNNNNNNNKKNKNNNNNNNQGGGNKGNNGGKNFNGKKPYQRLHSQKQFAFIDPKISGLGFSLSRDVKVSLGEAVFYDKKSRIAVLEFKSIEDAIRSLNILPLGLNYKLYLLDV
jgi:type II secretory pathway pseudopilin PulG